MTFLHKISLLAFAVLLLGCSDTTSIEEPRDTTETTVEAEQDVPVSEQRQAVLVADTNEVSRKLAARPSEIRLAQPQLPVATALEGVTYAVLRRGQTVTSLLSKYGFKAREVYLLAEALDGILNIDKLQAGSAIAIERTPAQRRLSFAGEYAERIDATLQDGQWRVQKQRVPTRLEVAEHAVVIDHSLYGNAAAAEIPGDVINAALLALSHFIDFQREVYTGNRFEVVFERTLVSQDEALFSHMQTPLQATYLRFQNSESDYRLFRFDGAFYLEDGRLAESFLLKTPLNGARLSSYYGQRKHPILGYTRMHKGIDFGAPLGTPIMAAGNGVIKRADWYGDYGNAVIIQHADGYETLYAHMHGFADGITAGVEVKQGDIIGFLGNTGLSQARHLHYEVYKNGISINPLNLKKLSSVRLSGTRLNEFNAYISSVATRTERLAQLESGARQIYAEQVTSGAQ